MQLILNCLYIFINNFLASFMFGLPPGVATVTVNVIKYAWIANTYVDIPAFIIVGLYCIGIHLSLMALSAILQLL